MVQGRVIWVEPFCSNDRAPTGITGDLDMTSGSGCREHLAAGGLLVHGTTEPRGGRRFVRFVRALLFRHLSAACCFDPPWTFLFVLGCRSLNWQADPRRRDGLAVLFSLAS